MREIGSRISLRTTNAQDASRLDEAFVRMGRSAECWKVAIWRFGSLASGRRVQGMRTRELEFCDRWLFMPERRRLRVSYFDVLVVRVAERIGPEKKPVG